MPRKITEIFSNPDNKNKKLKHNEKSSQDLINILDVDFELEKKTFNFAIKKIINKAKS